MNPRIASLDDISLEPASRVFPSPRDWRDQFIYFLLVDRFNDGKRRPKYNPEKTPQDRDPAEGNTFQGGTIKGLTQKLDYIQGLGATAIWLSPIVKNRIENDHSYHGYGVQDFLAIDPRFGTLDDVKELVHQAHARGLYVIFDIIINHTGNNWAYAGDIEPPYRPEPYEFGYWREVDPEPGFGPDDAVWPIEFQNPDWYQRRGRINNWFDHDEIRNGDFFGFKELDLENQKTLNALISVHSYWIAETDIDGFRIDTGKHMPEEATAEFCSRIREFAERLGKDNFFLFDEIADSDEVIKQYLTPNDDGDRPEYARMLNAALDFPLYFVLEEVIKGFRDPSALRERYDRLDRLYPHTDTNEFFVTFIDNHDQTARRWRRFLHNAPQEQAILAIGYLLTSQGIPSIYYGTEQGFDGGDDSDKQIRECMFGGSWGAFGTTGDHFFDTSHPVYTAIAGIADTRKREPALRRGRQYFRDISRDSEHFYASEQKDGIIAYSRILDSEELVIVLNLSGHAQTCSVAIDPALAQNENTFSDLLSPRDSISVESAPYRAYLPIALDPYQIRILKQNKL